MLRESAKPRDYSEQLQEQEPQPCPVPGKQWPKPLQQCGASVSISKIENDKLEAARKCQKLGQGAPYYYAKDDAVPLRNKRGMVEWWVESQPGSGSTA